LKPKIEETRWDISNEKKIWEKWEKEKIYAPNLNSPKIFSIDTPPPYPKLL